MNLDASANTTAAELERFLRAHPGTRYVDGLLIDLCGAPRGKRYPRADMAKLFTDGFQIPLSTHYLDVTGACLSPGGRGYADGDPDGFCNPVPGTLVPVPWSPEPAAQVLMTMSQVDGTPAWVEARNVLASVLKRFEPLELCPRVAFELEFYLIDAERQAGGCPRTARAPTTGRREDATQVYGIRELNAFSAFFSEVQAAGHIQNIPTSVTTSEYAPSQYEINLHHCDAPLTAADHCALLRHLVRSVAVRHGMEATFMSKPFLDTTGNGMHVHVSLMDRHGHNVFADRNPLGSDRLRHAIGGLSTVMPAGMAIFAPNVNAFRRFTRGSFVPTAPSWGADNRSVAFRIPAGASDSRRVEHRVAGADANPYLVLATVLAGIHHGIAERLDPGAPQEGAAGEDAGDALPLELGPALARLEAAEALAEYLGHDYVELYCATKRAEHRQFQAAISAREYAWYL